MRDPRFTLALLAVAMIATPVIAQEMPPALVETAPVEEMEFHGQLTLIGRSEATAESRIVSEVTGRVEAINAVEGRWAQRGDALVSINTDTARLSLEAKRAETAQAAADAELAEKDYKRAKDLFDEGNLSERNLDQANAELIRATERFKQLEAERLLLERQLAKCVIRAPFDGFTVNELVQVGEWVAPGTSVYHMVDLSIVKVTVDLPERYFGQVTIGSEVQIIVSGDRDNPMLGVVSGIAPSANATTHTFPVIVAVPNENGRLGSGMLVRAVVSLADKYSSLAVSKDAIVRQGDQTMVYTIMEGKATPIPVMLSSSNGTMVAVQGEGLAAGMPVVVRGNERIFPGSPVRTNEPPPAQEGEASEASAEGASQ